MKKQIKNINGSDQVAGNKHVNLFQCMRHWAEWCQKQHNSQRDDYTVWYFIQKSPHIIPVA